MLHGADSSAASGHDARAARASDFAWDRHLDQVADGAADGILVYDSECRVVHANPAAERILGLPREELLGRACDDPVWCLSSDGVPLERDELACHRTLQTGKAVRSTERSLERPDGSRISVLVSASPLTDDNGRTIGVINSFTDITRFKAAEEALRESDKYNRSLLRLYGLLGQATTYRAILDALMTEIPSVLGYRSAALLLMRDDPEAFYMLDTAGPISQAAENLMELGEDFREDSEPERFLVLPIGDDQWLKECASATRTIVMEDARTDPRGNKEIVAASGNRTIVVVPLMLAARRVGILNTGTFWDEGVRPPTRAQLEYLDTLAIHVAVAIDRVRFLVERREAQRQLENVCNQLESMLKGVVGALASTTSVRDPYTTMHQERVARLTCAIAEEMGLDTDRVETLRMAALLHDIGKIAVPAEILAKPAALTKMEMGLVRSHPALACELLGQVEFTGPVPAIVRQHHERLDGSGYPDGITCDQMLLESRILAVADVVEAMSAHRPYRPALGIDAALAEIEAGAGTRYDADAVAACTKIVRATGQLP